MWTGSLFNCAGTNNEIVLLHNQFESGRFGQCNDGAIVASITRVMDTISGSSCYISQLNFIVNCAMNNKAVICLHDNGTNDIIIDTLTVNITTGRLLI